MKSISINEIHERLLNTAIIFDKICTDNSIPYYMLGGTMLGAIRHKGFIPWDDDMDFGVPRPYYDRMIKLMREKLPNGYKCCTFENEEGCITAYAKISDTKTVIDDPRVNLPLEKQIGINLDIFPLDYCEKNNHILTIIRYVKTLNRLIYVRNAERIVWKNMLKSIFSKLFPFSQKQLLKIENNLAKKLTKGKYLANTYGIYGEKEVIPIEWYGEGCRFTFEKTKLSGIKEFDLYLQKLYGDYLTLPPAASRRIHVDNAFIKED